ncbi:MAG: invasion associated locus B family protein [Methylocystis sp.]
MSTKTAAAPETSKSDTKSKSDSKSKGSSKSKSDADKNSSKNAGKGPAKPLSIGKFGDWEALSAQGKDKLCYALGAVQKRQPEGKLKDAKANIFVSTRPSEGVRNEIAINLGYATKENGAATADVDGTSFELVTMKESAWLKNPAQEKEFVESMKHGSKLVVKAASAKGTSSTDTYSLKGLSDALARVQQECK